MDAAEDLNICSLGRKLQHLPRNKISSCTLKYLNLNLADFSKTFPDIFQIFKKFSLLEWRKKIQYPMCFP